MTSKNSETSVAGESLPPTSDTLPPVAIARDSEQLRQEGLEALEILDTPEEQEYNQLVYLASQLCATPISLVSLVDKNRQWFKAAIGLPARETSRDVSFCSHAIQQPNLFIVEDATQDTRFQDNLLVTGAPNIRFYAGLPLQAPNGAAVGTLCVIDTQPRILTEDQKRALTILGLQVQARMELRHQRAQLQRAMVELAEANARPALPRHHRLSYRSHQPPRLPTTHRKRILRGSPIRIPPHAHHHGR